VTDSPRAEATKQGVLVRFPDHTVRLDFAEPGILRVRKHPGDAPPESYLIRYGAFRDDWPKVDIRVSEEAGTVTASSDLLTATLDAAGVLTVADAAGNALLSEHEAAFASPDPGMRLRFDLPAERRFFGLGDHTRDRIEHRGTKGSLWIRNVNSYIPIPFVWTNDGLGMVMNTTRMVDFDFGATSPDWFGFSAEGATVDYYVVYGPSPRDILDRYTALTGRPALPPRWALGLWFICTTQYNAREFIDDCYTFRREHIPCDAIGLEPRWMSKIYDFSVAKDWSDERFHIPAWDRPGKANFVKASARMGFKLGLWLCNDYDLSYEEERQVASREAEGQDDQADSDAGTFVDAKLQGARRLDTITRPDEPWFDHLKKFVDDGACWFKQDGANQVIPHPDRLWGNGMLDDEMHNLYPLLYAKQMHLGFRHYTGRRTFGFTCAGWAGIQRYTGTWAGDTGGEHGPLAASLNLSLAGHGMTTCDMANTTKPGIHFGFFQPWSQVLSWSMWRHPWLLGDELKPVFLDYVRLRYRLLPYLYSIAWEAHTTGMPMLRAMPIDYLADPKSHGLMRQYMFGPAFLVAAFTDRVYLPEGEWFDYWTDQLHAGPKWVEPEVPADRGGPLFVRAGSIVPMGRLMDYVGQKPDDELTLHVYPNDSAGFTLYEDDGTTYAFEQGACRTTEIRQDRAEGQLRITVAAASGTFNGALAERTLAFVVHGIAKPQRVTLNDAEIDWDWDEDTASLQVAAGQRAADAEVLLTVWA